MTPEQRIFTFWWMKPAGKVVACGQRLDGERLPTSAADVYDTASGFHTEFGIGDEIMSTAFSEQDLALKTAAFVRKRSM